MEDYTLKDVLIECQILAGQNKSAKKKREREYLDKRNYLIGLLHYKYGKTSKYIGNLFSMDDSTVRACKMHAYNLLSYNDITFSANACEFIQRFPYEFPSTAQKSKRNVTVVVSLDRSLYNKVKVYSEMQGDDRIDVTVKNIINRSMKIWGE